MFDLTGFLISSAQAADAVAPAVAPAAADATASGTLMRFLPFFMIFAVFYFLLLRPQQKKLDDQTKMQDALKKGDKVYIGPGIVGTVVKVEDERHLLVDIAKDTQIKILKSAVTSRVSETAAAK